MHRLLLELLFAITVYCKISQTTTSTLCRTQSLSPFCNRCPHHHNLFCCRTDIIISLILIFTWSSLTLTSHIHLIILISAYWTAASFSFLRARSHFHATWYLSHNCSTVSLY